MDKKKRLMKYLLSCCFAVILPALNTQAATKSILPIAHWQTNNGAQVYYVALPELPIVDISIIFQAGSAQDGQQYGLSSFTNNLIGEGTKNLSADEIAEKFDSLGAIYSTNAGRDGASISLRSLTYPKQLQPALETYIDTISDSTFPDDSFNRVKNQTLQAIQRQQQSPSKIATKTFYENLYGNLPYGHNPIGETSTVKSFTKEDVAKFYHHYYVAKNATIVIVGNVSRQQAKDMANNMVAAIPSGHLRTSPNETQQSTTTQKSIHIDYPSSQTYIRIGELGITRSSPDYFPLYVGNYILGGGVLVSRLFTEVREKKGLTYNVSSTFIPMKKPGPFVVALQTRNQERDNAIHLTTTILGDFLKKGPTAKELTSAKQNIIGGFPLRLASNSAIMAQVATIGFYHLPLDYLNTYRDNVNKVTTKGIAEAFKTHIHPDELITVTVGPKRANNNS